MKNKMSIIFAGLCSIAAVYAMQNPIDPQVDVLLQTLVASGIITEPARQQIIQNPNMILLILQQATTNAKLKPDYSKVSLADLNDMEKALQDLITLLSSGPHKEVLKPAINLLNMMLKEIQKGKDAKMSFAQRHAKLLIFGGLITGVIVVYLAYKHVHAEKEEPLHNKKPLKNDAKPA
jgi:hypothetical protein